MTRSIAALIIAPTRFFEARRADFDRWPPLLIVALTGGITLGAQLLLSSMSVIGDQPTVEYVTHTLQVSLPALTVSGAAISFGHVFGYWLLYSVIFYLLTVPFAAAGEFRTLFWLTGWGFFPWFLAGAVWLLAMILSAFSVPAPTMPAGNGAFVQAVQDTMLVQVTEPLDYVGTLWSLGLWTVAVSKVRGVKRWQAVLAVLPVGLFELAKILLFM